MPWKLEGDSPIYLQLMDRIKMDIVSGRYHAGDKLPAVRELAQEAAVNPNTMQKALAELERIGLVHSKRTSGRFITEEESMLEQMRLTLAKEHMDDFMKKMESLSFHKEEILALLMENDKEGI